MRKSRYTRADCRDSEGVRGGFVPEAAVHRQRTRGRYPQCIMRHLVSRLKVPRADDHDINETAA